MLTSPYRRRDVAMAIQLAMEDPERVKSVLAWMRKSGTIADDDLVYLDRIADRWIRIARDNRRKLRH